MSKTIRTGILITGDASGAIKQVKLTDAELKNLNTTKRTATSRAKELGEQWGRTAKMAISLGAGIVAATAVALTAMVKSQMASIDATTKQADKLGILTQNLVGLQHAGAMTGVAIDTTNMALQRMTRRVAEAANGSGEAVNALKELNISAKELARLSPDKQFSRIADEMNKVEGQGNRVRLAMKLFDSEGVSLVNTLKLGSAGLAEMQAEAERMGVAISRIDAAKIEMANDAMARSKMVAQGFAQQLTIRVAPVLADITERMFGFAKETDGAGKTADKVFSYITKGVGIVANALHAVKIIVKGIEVAFGAVIPKIIDMWTSVARAAVEAYNMIPGLDDVDFNTTGIAKLQDSIRHNHEEAKKELQALMMTTLPSQQIETYLAGVERASNRAAEIIAENSSAMQESIEETNNTITEAELKRASGAQQFLLAQSQSLDMLRREVEARRDGEAALAQFNRAKHIEMAMRSTNAQQLLPSEQIQYAILVAQQYDLSEAMAATGKTAQTLAARADPMAVVWERSIQRVDDSFADLFRRMVRDGKVAFDDLKTIALETIGEMIYAAARNKILISMGTSVASSAAAAGANTIAGGAISSAGGAIIAGKSGGLLASGSQFLGGLTNGAIGTNSMIATGASSAGASIASMIGAIPGWGWAAMAAAAAAAILDGDGKKRVTLGVETDSRIAAGSRGMTDYQVRAASGLLLTGRSTRSDGEVANSLVDVLAGTDAALTEIYQTLTGHTAKLAGQSLAGKSSQAGLGTQDSGINSFFGEAAFNKLTESGLRDIADSFLNSWTKQVNSMAGESISFTPLMAMRTESESLAETLIRANNQLKVVNSTLSITGHQAYETSVNGMLLADSLASAFDSLEAMAQSSDFYYRNFFSEQERAGMLVDQYARVMNDFNGKFATAISGKDDLRAYVQALDLTSAAGREAYASAMNLAPAIAGMDSAMKVLTGNIGQMIASVSSGVGTFRERLFMDFLGTADKQYAYIKSQTDTLGNLIGSLDNSDAIASAMQKITALSEQAYNLLDEEGQSQQVIKFIDHIGEMERRAAERMQELQQQNGERNAQAQREAIELAGQQMANQLAAALEQGTRNNEEFTRAMHTMVSQFVGVVQSMTDSPEYTR